jgi:hypothetical protein
MAFLSEVSLLPVGTVNCLQTLKATIVTLVLESDDTPIEVRCAFHRECTLSRSFAPLLSA